MPLDKELSRPGAPAYGVNPKDLTGYLDIKSPPFVVRGVLPPTTANSNLALVHNTVQDGIYNKNGSPKFGPTGFYPTLYKPTGLLYGR